MPIYNLIEYRDAINEIIDFLANNNNSASFKSKQQIIGQT